MTMTTRLTAMAACALFTAGASADTVTLTPVKDNTLFEDPAGTLSNGVGAALFAGRTNFTDVLRRAVMAFDVASAVPAGSQITGVSLTLTVTQTRNDGREFRLHKLLADWGEGASDASLPGGGGTSSAPGDATWIHRFSPGDLWTTAGGDFEFTPSAATIAGPTLGAYTWSGTGMVADVQGWLDSPATNFGWILIGDESTLLTACRFSSREETIVSQRPTLMITFTGPVCDGDLNSSGAVDFGDVGFALANFEQFGFAAITIILANFGSAC